MSHHTSRTPSRGLLASLIHKVHSQLVVADWIWLEELVDHLAMLRKYKSPTRVPRVYWYEIERHWGHLYRSAKEPMPEDYRQAFALFTQARVIGPYRSTDEVWPCAHAAFYYRCLGFPNQLHALLESDLPNCSFQDIAARDRKIADAEASGDKVMLPFAHAPKTVIGNALWVRFGELLQAQLPDVSDLHSECVWEYLQACRQLGVAGEFTPPPRRRSGKPDPKDRDACIYFERQRGTKLERIKEIIDKRRDWEPLYNLQSISAAAKRFAMKNGFDWPIQRVQRLISAE